MNMTHLNENMCVTAKRQSNIELLRLFAMFLVLLVHANANALGYPDADDAHAFPVTTFIRSFIFGLTMVAVNVFVLISGWFGIRPTLRGLAKFCFQVFFVLTFVVVLGLVSGKSGVHGSMLLECFALFDNCWFAVAYLGLYLVAPILNAFVEKADKRILGFTVAALVIYSAVYGMMYSASYLDGYSAFNFMVVYLVGRYVKLYGSINWWGGVLDVVRVYRRRNACVLCPHMVSGADIFTRNMALL